MAALSPMGAFFLFLIMFIGTCFLLKVNVAFGVGIGCVTLLIFGHYANTPFLQASFPPWTASRSSRYRPSFSPAS